MKAVVDASFPLARPAEGWLNKDTCCRYHANGGREEDPCMDKTVEEEFSSYSRAGESSRHLNQMARREARIEAVEDFPPSPQNRLRSAHKAWDEYVESPPKSTLEPGAVYWRQGRDKTHWYAGWPMLYDASLGNICAQQKDYEADIKSQQFPFPWDEGLPVDDVFWFAHKRMWHGHPWGCEVDGDVRRAQEKGWAKL